MTAAAPGAAEKGPRLLDVSPVVNDCFLSAMLAVDYTGNDSRWRESAGRLNLSHQTRLEESLEP